MSASYAKAVMPRFKKNGELQREPDWDPGWVFPIKVEPGSEPKTDVPTNSELRTPADPAHLLTRDETKLKDCS